MKNNICCEHPASPPRRKELNDTPVKLCNEISRLFHGYLRTESDMEGVMSQPGARLVLSFLAIGDGTTQLELVRATHLKAPTISLILRKMEDEGIVRRQSDERDMRAIRVYLTEKGRRIDELSIRNIKALDAIACDGLSDDECRTLMLLLTKIRNNLVNSGEEEKHP